MSLRETNGDIFYRRYELLVAHPTCRDLVSVSVKLSLPILPIMRHVCEAFCIRRAELRNGSRRREEGGRRGGNEIFDRRDWKYLRASCT